MSTLTQKIEKVSVSLTAAIQAAIAAEKSDVSLGKVVKTLFTGRKPSADNLKIIGEKLSKMDVEARQQLLDGGLTTAAQPYNTFIRAVRRGAESWKLKAVVKKGAISFEPIEEPVEEPASTSEASESDSESGSTGSGSKGEVNTQTLAEFMEANLNRILSGAVDHGESLGLSQNDATVQAADLLVNYAARMYTANGLDVRFRHAGGQWVTSFTPTTDSSEAEKAHHEAEKAHHEAEKAKADLKEKAEAAAAKKATKPLTTAQKKAAAQKLADKFAAEQASK